MEIEKILWPNDLSKCSEASLPYVSSLAKKYGATVYVLYVTAGLAHHESWYGNFDKSHINKIIEWDTKKAMERMQEVCEKHLEVCKAYSKHVVVGDPAKEILDFVQKESIDMVVMCRKGEGSHFNMGGVAQKVVSNSPVPVVITEDKQGE
jgi:nucleotide-binding universal stress UspA family protein